MTLNPLRRFKEREEIPFQVLAGIGALSGYISGLLGVGGGGIILPLLIVSGLDPRIAVTVTPLSVPFSSFTSFLTYMKLGGVDWDLVLISSIPASIAGYVAGYIQRRIKIKTLRKILALVLALVAIKFALKFF